MILKILKVKVKLYVKVFIPKICVQEIVLSHIKQSKYKKNYCEVN